jgi:hypothetical protein
VSILIAHNRHIYPNECEQTPKLPPQIFLFVRALVKDKRAQPIAIRLLLTQAKTQFAAPEIHEHPELHPKYIFLLFSK